MSRTGVITAKPETLTLQSELDLSAKQYFLAKFDGSDDELLALATDASAFCFAIQEGYDGSSSAKQEAVAIGGVTKVKLGGTVAAGAKLTADSNSKAVATTTDTNHYSLVALQGGVANDIIAAKVEFGMVAG